MTAGTGQVDPRVGTPGLIQPPPDPLLAAIPLDVRDKWRRNPTPELIRRLELLSACGPRPSDDRRAMNMMCDRAVRAAWETYLYCAFACGLFEGQRGKDLRARLASKNPDGFRSAMAECLACWFLAGKLRFPVTADAPGRGRKVLDMKAVIDNQVVGVEVKAPYRERPPPGPVGLDQDSDLLGQRLGSANKQFADDVPNVLVLVPELTTRIFTYRTQLVTALYGEEKITWPIDTRTGGPAGPITAKFCPKGRLLRLWQQTGVHSKLNGMPRYTRVSAVIVIEERRGEKYRHPIMTSGNREEREGEWETAWAKQNDLHFGPANCMWIDHDVLIAHNPFALHPIPPDRFPAQIQFMHLASVFGWNDGAPL